MNSPPQEHTIGPFTKEKFSLPKWKHVTDKIYQLNTTNEEETIPDCQEILQLLYEVNSAPNLDEYFGEPYIKKYFLNEFFLNNAKYLIATKTFNNPLILDLSNSCLQQIAMLWLKAIPEDNSKLTETAKLVFDLERSYYKVNNQEEATPALVVTNSLYIALLMPSASHPSSSSPPRNI